MKKIIPVIALLFLTLSCGRELPELEQPAPYMPGDVISVQALEANKICVKFSIEVNPSSAETIACYKLLETNLVLSYAEMGPHDERSNGLSLLRERHGCRHDYNLIVDGVLDTEGYTVNVSTNAFNSFGSDDYIVPVVNITQPVAHQLLGKSFRVYGSAHDSESGIDHVEIKVDGGEWVNATGKEIWSYTLDTSLYNETYKHTVYAKAVDLMGNASIDTVIVSIDRTDPVLTLTAPSADGKRSVASAVRSRSPVRLQTITTSVISRSS
jgi:hypothetical protein